VQDTKQAGNGKRWVNVGLTNAKIGSCSKWLPNHLTGRKWSLEDGIPFARWYDAEKRRGGENWHDVVVASRVRRSANSVANVL